jgi:hypothetical protein
VPATLDTTSAKDDTITIVPASITHGAGKEAEVSAAYSGSVSWEKGRLS